MKITYITSIINIILNNNFNVDSEIFDELHSLSVNQLALRYKQVYYAFAK
ncbi:hypothetical protein [Fulvivirga lutea]|uniref:Uncharacterized protein n=1 Tax=Fulvivirga lutea TaxID=2810512 RepID=A0A974WFK7_9BACT|nr:hypothetical protein [Fulvivirga lutea]QSE97574.1 hypothetical protein JR347_00355 [Fulvivirga lutea]